MNLSQGGAIYNIIAWGGAAWITNAKSCPYKRDSFYAV
jgi:hypothetical protein